MTLAPLLAASLAVKVHVACMAVAVALSGPQFLMRKGTARHRAVGYVWFAAMTLAALTSFFIVRKAVFGPFGPIHILSVVTIVAAPLALRAAIRGDVALHKRIVTSLFWGAVVGAGLFTLLPGRIMHAVFFGN